jgi:hypothetical protein
MNGYTQLNLLGRNRGLKFGALAAEQIMVKLAKLSQDTGGIYTSSMIAEIIYWGLVNNCYVKREDPDFTFEQVVDWVDENWLNTEMAESITGVVKCFEESKSAKALTEKVTEVVEKKKAEMNGPQSDPSSAEKPDTPSTTTTE